MISSYEKLKVADQNKSNDVVFEVNWNKHDESTKDCKLVRITVGGKSAIIKKEDLISFLFIIGKEDEQRNLIPQQITRSRGYTTVVTVKAKHDIKEGDDVTFPLELTLPDVKQEVIKSV